MEVGNFIINSIGAVGFPIVMCLIIFWYLNEERKSHTEETATLSKTIEENTKAIVELKDVCEFLRSGKENE